LQSYLDDGALTAQQMGRGYTWLDTGTHASLLDTGNFVRTLQSRHDLQAGCSEGIDFEHYWLSAAELNALANKYAKTDYGKYLNRFMAEG
jgi:glucose-1-phosphate thymidylyltransferase